jgi:hypothetical protein
MSTDSDLREITTATLGLDENDLVILREFGGGEFEIDVKTAGLVRAGTATSALGFIKELLNRSMRDTLILANLSPRRRGTPAPAKAPATQEDKPRVFVNRADKEMQEKLEHRHGIGRK